ncbi:MAG: RelA/SpoT family protein [Chloroflexota bacterium]|nr:TGS domain-containing protein [Lentimicrobium sp.]
MKIKDEYLAIVDTCQPFLNDRSGALLKEIYNLLSEHYKDKSSLLNRGLMSHVIDLAEIAVKELNLGFTSVIASLYTYADHSNNQITALLKQNNLQDAVEIASSFRKISDLPTDRLISNADNYTGIMLTLASDVRAILLTLAENLYFLRNAEFLKNIDLKNTLSKAVNVYIPLAHKLGLYRIKSELEEITFMLSEPETYKRLAKEIENEVNRNTNFIKKFIEPVENDMQRLGLKFSIKSRTKSVSSVHNKMVKQKIPFDEIFDLFAIRIIIETPAEDEKADCWKAYSVVTNLYTPETSRMRDWITIPRPNGYESLHITVKDKTGRVVEVQIRSLRMHMDAEQGNAAHWRYKGHKGDFETSAWIDSVRQMLENPEMTEDKLISKEISAKVPDNIIYVFTPAGDLVKMKDGNTVLDFAFELHTAIGSRCTGGRVNHKIVPIRQKLKNGDIVEIITSKNQIPNRDWLNWVTTSKAKNKIKRHLKEAEFKLAETGKDILKRKLIQIKVPFNDETVSRLISFLKFENALAFYQQLAENKIDPAQIKEILTGTVKEVQDTIQVKESAKPINRTGDNTIVVNQSAELQGYILAQCCNPVMGDDIFGFVMAGGGIKIHRTTCPNAPRLKSRYPYRVMDALWSKVAEGSYFISNIHVSGIDQLGILNSITELLSSEMKIDVRNIALNSKGGKFEGYIKVSVRDSRHIDSLMKKIEGLKGVTRVKRIQ